MANNNVTRFIDSVIENVVFNRKNFDAVRENFLIDIDNNPSNCHLFLNKIDDIRRDLADDLNFYMESDPAIDSEEEVKIAYPGFKAICFYRIAHVLREMGYKLQSRIISEIAHNETGIDIHPGATIACPFFIDHGTGIVIGETAIIGKYVKLYQGVTLGALSLSKGSALKGTKRHPTIGNNVTIYSNTSIFGNITVGDNVTIGGCAFIIDDIPSNTKVYLEKPSLIIKKK